jgi:uncharacterized protein (TIGR03437 family)
MCVLLNAWPAQSQGIVTTFAGNGNMTFSGDGGPATAASLNLPRGLAINSAGGVYISDTGNSRVRLVSPAGIISTVAGNGSYGATGDGGQATNASFSDVTDIALDAAGNLYIADASNHRIRKVTPGGIVTTVAGTGVQGSSGDGGLAIDATLNRPISVALDAAGNLYICDSSNHNVRRVSLASGMIAPYAGNGTAAFSGDGGLATAASLNFPLGVATDKYGYLYIADSGNNSIRRVSPGGMIVTVAGTGNLAGFAGDGAAANGALLNIPSDVAVDGSGNLFIADSGNNRVRKVDGPSGIIGTIAGGDNDGFSGDAGPAVNSLLSFPWKLATDPAGAVYIADRVNNRIRKISAGTYVATLAGAPVTSVSAASNALNASLAPSLIASAYGKGLADSTVNAPLPLPATVANVGVIVKDAAGNTREAQLYFISANQINYVVPDQTSVGTATVTMTKNGQTVGSGTIQVAAIAPGIFAANGNGQGAASAEAVKYPSQTWQFTASCPVAGSCVTVPFDVGTAATPVYLELYGTGIRGTKSSVTATIGGTAAAATWGVQSQYPGMDQVNLLVPTSLAGRGDVDVVIAVDGVAANTVRVNIK